MERFFIFPEQIKEGRIFFSPEESFQIRKVLRLKSGARVSVLDNRGMEGEVELTCLSQKGVEGVLLREVRHPVPPGPLITLALSNPSHARMDWIIQKSTELGVDRILPFTSRRCVRKVPGKNRMERWQKIAKEAAEQSRRIFLPEVGEIISFTDLLEWDGGKSLKIIFWEGEKENVFRSLMEKELSPFEQVLMAIGPEGGFEEEEVEAARRAGFISAGLGREILRVETAALAALSIIQFSLGRIG